MKGRRSKLETSKRPRCAEDFFESRPRHCTFLAGKQSDDAIEAIGSDKF
jgi:hypothetical protein